ncbi:hypothetical protein [Lysinibacillus antri]|uniref:Uncharacterized protein n=1 Tax=Lysinibacillus antri TaxID=2498145 RepID=A0A432L715_9BACI|nr:hypothetical protein [Lysinibacillus antri]RUL47234.1 hypothetical protein EK386_18775 [Lysinibacillus antri]
MKKTDNFFYEAMLYAFKDQENFWIMLRRLIDEIEESEGIYFNVNILEKNLYNRVSSFHTYENNGNIQLCIINNLMWMFVEDVFEYTPLLEKIESKLSKYISKIPVTNKYFVDSIFNSNFSDNLLEINIEGEDISEFETETFTGSFINKTFEYRNIIKFNNIYIRYIKFQPLKLNVALTLRFPNVIQFSDYIDFKMYQNLIKSFSNYIYKTNKKLLYINKGEEYEENNNSNY